MGSEGVVSSQGVVSIPNIGLVGFIIIRPHPLDYILT